MQALRFHNKSSRLVVTALLGRLTPRAYVGPFAPIGLEALGEPELPGDDWALVRTTTTGICGSDLKQVRLAGSYDNPMTAVISFPHVLGHEAVGVVERVGAGVTRVASGQRVLLYPSLSCAPRGLEPCEACLRGDTMLCLRVREGRLPPSIHLGNCSAVPGTFAERFVAHESQLFAVPDALTDDVAVLADPFCVALHAVLRHPPPAGAPALVYGLGSIGLLAVTALKAVFPETEVWGVARYPHQASLARRLGVDRVLSCRPRALVDEVAEAVGAERRRPWRGLDWLMEGAGVVYDTVASAETLEAGVRVVRAQGEVVVIGVERPRRFEWTPIYYKEVAVVGSNAFGVEDYRGARRHAIDIYLELCSAGLDASAIVTHHFALGEWRQAFLALMRRRRSGAVKVVFEFGE